MVRKNINKLQRWAPWLLGWLFIFLALTSIFLGLVEQSIFSGKFEVRSASAEVFVETEDNKILLSIAYGFFGSVIIIVLILSGVQIYKIKYGK